MWVSLYTCLFVCAGLPMGDIHLCSGVHLMCTCVCGVQKTILSVISQSLSSYFWDNVPQCPPISLEFIKQAGLAGQELQRSAWFAFPVEIKAHATTLSFKQKGILEIWFRFSCLQDKHLAKYLSQGFLHIQGYEGNFLPLSLQDRTLWSTLTYNSLGS